LSPASGFVGTVRMDAATMAASTMKPNRNCMVIPFGSNWDDQRLADASSHVASANSCGASSGRL
jgi:hypothetical protein